MMPGQDNFSAEAHYKGPVGSLREIDARTII